MSESSKQERKRSPEVTRSRGRETNFTLKSALKITVFTLGLVALLLEAEKDRGES